MRNNGIKPPNRVSPKGALKNDASGALFHIYDKFILDIRKKIDTVYMKLLMRLRSIEYGMGCSFYGRVYFRRYYGSIISIGADCRFRSSFLSNYVGLSKKCLIATHQRGAKILIGNNVGMSGTVIGAAEMVAIGDDVLCGGNTFITDFDWHERKGLENLGGRKSAPVIIERGVWLGLNVVVLKGVTVGEGSIIGANSVVTRSIPANVIAAGNPCKVIREI